jgi:hypothetical protein
MLRSIIDRLDGALAMICLVSPLVVGLRHDGRRPGARRSPMADR